jgi:hypothetical protein
MHLPIPELLNASIMTHTQENASEQSNLKHYVPAARWKRSLCRSRNCLLHKLDEGVLGRLYIRFQVRFVANTSSMFKSMLLSHDAAGQGFSIIPCPPNSISML